MWILYTGWEKDERDLKKAPMQNYIEVNQPAYRDLSTTNINSSDSQYIYEDN